MRRSFPGELCAEKIRLWDRCAYWTLVQCPKLRCTGRDDKGMAGEWPVKPRSAREALRPAKRTRQLPCSHLATELALHCGRCQCSTWNIADSRANARIVRSAEGANHDNSRQICGNFIRCCAVVVTPAQRRGSVPQVDQRRSVPRDRPLAHVLAAVGSSDPF